MSERQDNPTRLTATEHALLSSVAEMGEAYGLQLVKRGPDLKVGAVYASLARLAERGFLSSCREVKPPKGVRGPSRRFYKVTEAGACALRAWEAAREVWDQSS